jgi:hypothetical protein
VESFLKASRRSTRHVDGPYLHDFQKFITLWKREHHHLVASSNSLESRIEDERSPNEHFLTASERFF